MGDRYVEGFEAVNANIRRKLGSKNLDESPAAFAGVVPSAVATYVTTEEKGDSLIHQTVFTLAALPITMRDTEQGGGAKIYTFPKGRILFLGGSGQITPTTTSAILTTLNGGVTCNWGVGTTTQASATLATTEQDLIQVAAWVSSTVINTAPAASTAGKGVAIVTPYAGVSTATAAFLNLAVALNTDIDGDAAITVSGTIALTWLSLGAL